MITQDEEASTDGTPPTAAARGIVRSAAAWWAPTAAVLLVAGAHAATVPMDAWLPLGANEAAIGRAFVAPLGTGTSWMLSFCTWAATLLPVVPWPMRLASLPLAATALTAALLCVSFRRVGMPGLAAGLLAIVASTGPLAWAQATTPLGAAPAAVAAAGTLRLVMRRTRASRAAVALVVVSGMLAWLLLDPADGAGSLRGVREELGSLGLLLLLIGLVAGRRVEGARPWTLAVVGAGAWALASPLDGHTQVAVATPFAWTLVATGLVALVGWRRSAGARHATVWLTLGLLAWTGVHAGARPWLGRRDMTLLARHWAQAVSDVASQAPVVTDGTPASHLVDAWGRGTPAFGDRITVDALAATVPPPPVPFTLLPALAGSGRWMGLAPTSTPVALTTLASLAAAMPRNTIVAVGLSRDAATQLGPESWHALATLGSRIGSGGPARARALVGVGGDRRAGSEGAGASDTTLVLLPGDLIGQTGRPSPVDLRIEAGADHVRLFERDRLRIAAPGIVVAIYRSSGVRLGLWSGPDAQSLNGGVPATDGPVVGRAAGALACRDLPAHTPADVTDLGIDGALGVTAPAGTRVRVATTWADGHPGGTARIVGAAGADGAAKTESASDLRVMNDAPFGLDLRGRPATVRLEADMPGRVCQGPSVAPVVTAPSDGASVPTDVHPRVESAFGGGWHDMEPMGGGRYFRWMAGARATLLFTGTASADTASAPLRLTLDAQSVGTPGPSDRFRVALNGEWLAPDVLRPGRSHYTWTLPGAHLREGLNELLLETSVTLRPSDVAAGADGRLLGLALYGWHVTSADTDPPANGIPAGER